jgi:hypothetical protein
MNRSGLIHSDGSLLEKVDIRLWNMVSTTSTRWSGKKNA